MTDAIDRRGTAQIGRHARLELVFAVRGGRTVLAHAYAEPPFRTGPWFADGSGVHMIIASSAPGLFGGDRFEQLITVEEGARVRLTSQSALQVHPSMDLAPAIVRSTYRIAEHAELSCHWDPVIPFRDARLDQRIEIAAAASSRLYWSDAMMSGRAARGERWLFTALAHELRITRAGALAYLERFRIAPERQMPSQAWVAADASFFGTAIQAGTGAIMAENAAQVHQRLAAIAGVSGAADAISTSLLVVRLMGASGLPFHEARARVREHLDRR